mgnify:CR=1 FL=1
MKLSLKNGFTLIELMIVIAIIAIIAAIAIPNLIEARKSGNESAAIGALKTISTSQSMYREQDKDQDGTLDYATLIADMSTYNVIDPVLGAGTKQGYIFTVGIPTGGNEQFVWTADANPVIAGTTGDRRFGTNQTGTIYYSATAAIVFEANTGQVLPANGKALGQ